MSESLFHFEPLPEIFNNYSNDLQYYVDSVNNLYENRYKISENELEQYKKIYNELKKYSNDQEENEYIKWFEQYFKKLINTIQKEFDNTNLAIICFLIYYIKTPYIIIDDPILEKVCKEIPGCPYAFIHSFIELSTEDRLKFIVECNDAGINFNIIFKSLDECQNEIEQKLLENLQSLNFYDILNTFKNTNKTNLTSIQLENNIKNDFAKFYLTLSNLNKKQCFNEIKKYIKLQNIELENIDEFISEIIDEMLTGSRNELINSRLHQKLFIDKLYKNKDIMECSDNIEENTLYKVHEKLRNYYSSKKINSKRKHFKYQTNINNSFLLQCSENRILTLQTLYKICKKSIFKIIHKCPNILKDSFNISSLHSTIQSCDIKDNIEECEDFFKCFYELFNHNLSLLHKLNDNKQLSISKLNSETKHKIEYDDKYTNKFINLFSKLFSIIDSNNFKQNEEQMKLILNKMKIDNSKINHILFSIESKHYKDAIYSILNHSELNKLNFNINLQIDNNLFNSEKYIETIIEQCKENLNNLYLTYDNKKNASNDSEKLISCILKSTSDFNKIILSFCKINCLIDTDCELYLFSQSFKTKLLNTNNIEDVLSLDDNLYLPEFYLIKNNNTNIFENYVNNFIKKNLYKYEDSSAYLDEKITDIYIDNLCYIINDNGSINVYNKDKINKDNINIYECESFDNNDIMSKLSYLQYRIDLILKHKLEDCIHIALDILLYQPFTIIKSDICNEYDLFRLKNLLSFINDDIMFDIGIEYLVRSSVQIFRNIVMECFYKELNTKSTTLFSTCINLSHFNKLFTKIESTLNITLPHKYKYIIFTFFNNLLNKMKISTSDQTKKIQCCICKKEKDLSLQTVVVQEYDETFVDRVENFCSIECMDIHLASAPVPTEKDIKYMYIRSIFRDIMKKLVSDEKQMLNIIRYFKLQKIQQFAKLHKIKNVFNSKVIKENSLLQEYINTVNIEISTQNLSKFNLIKTFFYTKDDKNKYMFLQLFNLNDIEVNSDSNNIDYFKLSLINLSFIQNLQSFFTLLEQISKHLLPKFDLDKLFKHKIFIKLFFSIISEFKEDIQEIHCDTTYLEDCKQVTTKMIKDWVFNSCKNTQNFDFIENCIKQFDKTFHCNKSILISNKESMVYINITKSIILLYIVFNYFKEHHSYKLENINNFIEKMQKNELLSNLIDSNFTLNNMFDTLKLFSNQLPNNINILLKYYYKLIHNITNIISPFESIQYILNFTKCNFDSFIENILNSLYISLLLFDSFLLSNKQSSSNSKINNNTQTENSNNEPESIDKWIDNLEHINPELLQAISTTNIDNINTDNININTNDIEETKEETNIIIDTESESESESETEFDDFKQLENQLEMDNSLTKKIHPTIQLIYKQLVNSKKEDDIIDILETILPENIDFIDDSFIDSLNKVQNYPTIENKLEFYEKISKLADHPLYLN